MSDDVLFLGEKSPNRFEKSAITLLYDVFSRPMQEDRQPSPLVLQRQVDIGGWPQIGETAEAGVTGL